MASPSFWTFFARVAVLTFLAALVARPAGAQSPSSLGTDWVGSVRCDIKATAPGYMHEERQTWTISGPPTVQGSQLVYPAAWTVTGQGTHDRTGSTSRRVAQWTAAVPGPNPPVNAPISFQAAPVTGQINVRPWHSQLTRQGGYTGTEQYTNSGVPQPPGRLVATLYEWQMPNLVAEPKSTRISGSSTFEVRSQVGPLQPLSESQVIVACAWELGRGTTNPLPPSTVPDLPSSGSTSSNTPPAAPPGSTTPAGSTASTAPGSTPPANPPGSTTTPGGTAPPSSTSTAAILNVSPASLEQGALGSVLTIIGGSTRWAQGTQTVTVTVEPSIGPPVTNAQPVSDTSLLAQLDVQWSAAPGPRTVTVRSGNEVVTLANAFTVVARAQPVLVSATPNTPRSPGDQNVSLTLTGRNTRWAQGRTRVSVGIPVQGNFGSIDAPPNYVNTPAVTVHSVTSLTAVFNIPANATPGSYGVAVWDTSPGDWLKLVDVFTVTSASGSSSGPAPGGTVPASSNVAVVIDTTDLQFGQVNVGSEKALPATLTNRGTQPFGPINLFGGAPPSGVFNAAQNCQGMTLAPGQSCAITYFFAPASAGAATDASDFTISGTPNQSDGVAMRVALTGTGIAAGTGTPTATSSASGPTSSTRPVNSLPTVSTGGGGGLTTASGTPPTNPVDPSNFIATQTGEGTVRLTWNAVPGAGSYMLGGPGTNAGVAVTGTSHTVTGIAAGTHTWTVATNYNPGGVMTTPDKWSKTTMTLVTRTGRYRISLTGFRVNHETNAGPFGREHNAVYAAAAVEVINRSTQAVLQPITVVKSLVHGDTSKAGGRVRAGSASSTGGLLAGDTVPMGEDPASITRSTSTTTFPLLLWEGPLTDGVEVVAVRPTLWVWNGATRVYDAWLAGLSNPQRYLGDDKQAKMRSGNMAPSFGGGGFDIWCAESGIYDTAHVANCLPADDRPIGLRECNAFLGCWHGVVLLIARDGIERALSSPYQAGGSAPGVIQIHLADQDPSFGLNKFSGNYDLYLRVERVP